MQHRSGYGIGRSTRTDIYGVVRSCGAAKPKKPLLRFDLRHEIAQADIFPFLFVRAIVSTKVDHVHSN